MRDSGIPQRPKPPTQKVRLFLVEVVWKASVKAAAGDARTLEGEEEKKRRREREVGGRRVVREVNIVILLLLFKYWRRLMALWWRDGVRLE